MSLWSITFSITLTEPVFPFSHVKSKTEKKNAEGSDSDDSDVDDLDDEEVSLGSMDEEDFGEELEEEGGMFMDPDEGGDDEGGDFLFKLFPG